MKLVIGNFKTAIHVEGTVYTTHITNFNGLKLISFVAFMNTVIKSTSFPHSQFYVQTWVSPDGVPRNKIYYVFCEARHSSSITDVKPMRDENIDPDHKLKI